MNKLTERDIARLAERQTLNRRERRALEAYLGKNPDLRKQARANLEARQ